MIRLKIKLRHGWNLEQIGNPYLFLLSRSINLCCTKHNKYNVDDIILSICVAFCMVIHFGHYDNVIKWKPFPRYWPCVPRIHRSTVNSPHKGQWRGALMFSLTYAWTQGWVDYRKAGDLRRHRAHYDVTVMMISHMVTSWHGYTFYITDSQNIIIMQPWR